MSIKAISAMLMISTILLIAVFQVYWLHRVYSDTRLNLERETNGIFRDLVYNAQMLRATQDTTIFKKGVHNSRFLVNILTSMRAEGADSATNYRHNGKPRRIILSFHAERGGD